MSLSPLMYNEFDCMLGGDDVKREGELLQWRGNENFVRFIDGDKFKAGGEYDEAAGGVNTVGDRVSYKLRIIINFQVVSKHFNHNLSYNYKTLK